MRSATFRGFKTGNDGLYISTRFGNVSQLHHVKSPGAMRNQITYFEEPIGSVAMHPVGADMGCLSHEEYVESDPKSSFCIMDAEGD